MPLARLPSKGPHRKAPALRSWRLGTSRGSGRWHAGAPYAAPAAPAPRPSASALPTEDGRFAPDFGRRVAACSRLKIQPNRRLLWTAPGFSVNLVSSRMSRSPNSTDNPGGCNFGVYTPPRFKGKSKGKSIFGPRLTHTLLWSWTAPFWKLANKNADRNQGRQRPKETHGKPKNNRNHKVLSLLAGVHFMWDAACEATPSWLAVSYGNQMGAEVSSIGESRGVEGCQRDVSRNELAHDLGAHNLEHQAN